MSARRYATVLCLAGAVGAGGCAAATAGVTASSSRSSTISARSCALRTIAQQFSRARVIADGTMLPGPTVPGTGGVLASPARMRVAHYLKGSGQRMIRVTTGITARGGARSATDYGIQPHVGERWQIEATSRAQPYVTSDCAGSRPLPSASGTLPLPEGAAWYSRTLDSTPPLTPTTHLATPVTLRKWLLWSGELFSTSQSGRATTEGDFSWGDSEPGFGDWDALDVETVPSTPQRIMTLLRSGKLGAGQTDRATRTTPLIWLAQLSALLGDDPTTPAARAAAITAITSFPGVQQLGTMTDPQGRTGVAVAETATGLRPLTIATGPGCQNPIQGGAGCVGAASPRGSFRTTLIYDPTTDRPLSQQTALTADMPAAHLKAGTVLYQVSYLGGSIDPHPNIPSPAPPANRTVQSVPWQLASATGHTITVRWQSGTCDSQLPPNPEVNARETPQSITVSVYIHVVKGGFGFCAGVGLGGTNSTTLRDPIAGRKILHGTVTDHAR